MSTSARSTASTSTRRAARSSGLVGETGAGKTTLALSILGLLPERVGEITGGSIVFSGDELLEQGEAYMLGLRGRRVSMIFQDPMTSLNPVQTVGEQIGEVLKLHFPAMGREERRGRVDRGAEHGRHPGLARGGLPIPVLGRHEAARGHRHGAHSRAGAAAGGRADDGAGRHHPGADPGHDAPPAGGAGHDGAAR